jgi:hypothetical protein
VTSLENITENPPRWSYKGICPQKHRKRNVNNPQVSAMKYPKCFLRKRRNDGCGRGRGGGGVDAVININHADLIIDFVQVTYTNN